MIYISAPYSHKDKNVVEKRMSAVYEHFANLMMKGCVPVTPLMAHAVVTRHPVPSDAAFWEEYSLTLLSRSDKMHVLMIDGWEDSVGVQYEIAYCLENEIPLEYVSVN